MSYILDALRKSERQRRAGQVPGPADLMSDPPPPPRRSRMAFLIAALVLFNAAGLGYLWKQGSIPFPETPPTAVSGAPGSTPVTTPRTAVAQGQGTPSPAAPGLPVAIPQSAGPALPASPPQAKRAQPAAPAPGGGLPAGSPRKPEPPAETQEPKSVPIPTLAKVRPSTFPPKGSPGGPLAATPPVPPDSARPAPPVSPAPRPADRAEGVAAGVRPGDPPFLDALPAEFREKVPEFRINLYAYSETPAERFTIIDMKKYRVGERIPGGALLLEMRADSLVLELDGKKFRVPRI